MRARNIKPALFKNELLGQADPILTVLFCGLWCEADREGRIEDRPLRLRAEIFPYRPDLDLEGHLSWLQSNGFIDRYSVGKTNVIKVIHVIEFLKHQKPHKNEAPSLLPANPKKNNLGTKRAQPRSDVDNTKDVAARADSLFSDRGLINPSSLIPDSRSSALPTPAAPSAPRKPKTVLRNRSEDRIEPGARSTDDARPANVVAMEALRKIRAGVTAMQNADPSVSDKCSAQ